MKIKIFAISLLLLVNWSWAQTNTTQIEEVIVTENRTQVKGSSNRMVQTLTATDIKNSSSRTITELLENMAGVDIRSRGAFGTQADIQIRGGSFEQTLVLINGVKFTDPQTGHHLLNLPITLLDIDRIEILKGAAARIYGQNAYAGVVNIITHKPKGKSISGQLVQGQNSLSEQILSGEFAEGKYGQRISLSNLNSDGYKTNTDFKQQQAFYQLQRVGKKTEIDLVGGYLNKKMGANGFYTSSFPWQYEEIETAYGTLGFKHLTWMNLKSHFNYRQLHDMFELKRDTPSFSQNVHFSQVYAGDVSIGNKNFLGNWNAGLDFRSEQIKSSNLGNRNRTIGSAFVEQQIQYKNWLIVPGICFNNYSDFGFVSYPGLDVGYQHKQFHVSANVAKTFRVPTYTELYYKDGGKSSIGNPNLVPENAISWELNSNYQIGGFKAQAALFQRNGSNQIDWTKDSLTDPSWKAVNLGNLTSKGFDVNIQLNPKVYFKRNPISYINIGYCKTQLNRGASNEISRYIFDYLQSQLTGTIQITIYKALQANIRIRYEDRINYTTYWISDLKLAWQKTNYQIFAETSNVFNQTYYEVGRVQMPGRWMRLGANFKINL